MQIAARKGRFRVSHSQILCYGAYSSGHSKRKQNMSAMPKLWPPDASGMYVFPLEDQNCADQFRRPASI
jgi:hypothetical protein